MKLRIFISTIFLMLTIFTVFGQTQEKIKTINKTVEQINNDSIYTTKQLLNDYYVDTKNLATDNGQELKGYYKNGQLKKIVYTIGISCCMNIYEYYFTEGNLIFVYEKQDIYSALMDNNGEFIGLDYTRLEPNFEGSYYFDNQTIIKTETSGEMMFEGESNKKDKFLEDIKVHIQDLETLK